MKEETRVEKKKELEESKDRKGGEPRRLDDQEDGGDGVRAKDRGKGDKLRGDDGRKRRREEEIDRRKEINTGGEDDGKGMVELGSRMTNFLKGNVSEKKQQGYWEGEKKKKVGRKKCTKSANKSEDKCM